NPRNRSGGDATPCNGERRQRWHDGATLMSIALRSITGTSKRYVHAFHRPFRSTYLARFGCVPGRKDFDRVRSGVQSPRCARGCGEGQPVERDLYDVDRRTVHDEIQRRDSLADRIQLCGGVLLRPAVLFRCIVGEWFGGHLLVERTRLK